MNFLNNIRKIITIISIIFLFSLVFITCLNVFSRYVFNSPIEFMEELSGILIIWIIMLGVILSEEKDEHLKIDIVMELFPIKIIATIIRNLISLFFLAEFAYFSFRLAMQAGGRLTELLGIPYTYFDIAITIGTIGAFVYTLMHLFQNIRKKGDE